ncbi:MAG: trypsin-like peptidase domain-containing protein [Deltaproteobacteria bacterium]|nr:trypsin-like peptidase domain-containing protein [Deltaproteobacteria bacterium]
MTLMQRRSVRALVLVFALSRVAEARTPEPRGELSAEEKATIALFKESSHSVVYITSIAMRRDYFSFDLMEIPQGTGSGFVWDTAGHIVTNYHVIQNASAAQVTLDNQQSYAAELVGVEPDKDVAVLKIDVKGGVKAIAVGSSSDLQVGQKVLAIGNPFGLDQSLTTGVISALGREIKSATGRPITGVIQTDAVINPGNSGGPLLDSAGRLIGMNTAIYSPTGASVGIGFAVPVDTVNRIVEQLIRYGKVVRPTLGIVFAEDQVMRRLGIKGSLVLDFAPKSAAAAAGLRPTRRDAYGRVQLGDVVVQIEGKPVASVNDIYKAIDGHEVGDKVALVVERGDKRETVQVKLGRE